MKLALVMTIRNERRFLRRNLLYHRHLGVDHVYLYLDRCTDGSGESVADLPYVRVETEIEREAYRSHPGAGRYLKWLEHHTAQQCMNVIHALDLAREAGVDWLIHLDADELVCLDRDSTEPGQLRSVLAGLGPEVECVRFPPYEVCARRAEADDVFVDETIFVPPEARGRRTILDPIRGEHFATSLALGHRKGKSAVRVVPGLSPRGPHEFYRPRGEPLREVSRPHLLHYFVSDFRHFLQKFRNFQGRPDTYTGGKPIDRQKRLWRDLVVDPRFSQDALRAYYERWVLLPEAEIERRLAGRRLLGVPLARPSLVEIPAARKAFAELPD